MAVCTAIAASSDAFSQFVRESGDSCGIFAGCGPNRSLFSFFCRKGCVKMAEKKVAVIMGSDSDLPVVKSAIDILKELGIPTEVHVMSAHRTPAIACQFAANAREKGFAVLIAAAGKAAHLAGVLAAHTTLPVIGIPVKSSTLDGLDALLATVQMPAGIPVATVAIDGAKNAGLLAAQIIGVFDAEVAYRLTVRKDQMEQEVLEKDAKIQEQFQS